MKHDNNRLKNQDAYNRAAYPIGGFFLLLLVLSFGVQRRILVCRVAIACKKKLMEKMQKNGEQNKKKMAETIERDCQE